MLNAAGFDQKRRSGLWMEAAATATKLDNITIRPKENKTPYEMFFGEPTLYEQHLKTFGEVGVVTKNNNNKIKAKLDNRGAVGIFVGYAKNHAGDVY